MKKKTALFLAKDIQPIEGGIITALRRLTVSKEELQRFFQANDGKRVAKTNFQKMWESLVRDGGRIWAANMAFRAFQKYLPEGVSERVLRTKDGDVTPLLQIEPAIVEDLFFINGKFRRLGQLYVSWLDDQQQGHPETLEKDFDEMTVRSEPPRTTMPHSSDSPPPTCFLSYSWDSDSHKDWVRSLAEHLRQRGVDVEIDQWGIRAGQSLTRFMEKSITNFDWVVLLCTPSYVEKANAAKGGVGYEVQIITAEIFQDIEGAEEKFIPALREGSDVPAFISGRQYVDFRDDRLFSSKADELLRRLLDAPKHQRPPIGPNPFAS